MTPKARLMTAAIILCQLRETLISLVVTDGFVSIDGDKSIIWPSLEISRPTTRWPTGGTMAQIKLHSVEETKHLLLLTMITGLSIKNYIRVYRPVIIAILFQAI